MAAAWFAHFRLAGWELLCAGGGVLKVQAAGLTRGFEDRMESSRETSRVLFPQLLCQCRASLRGVSECSGGDVGLGIWTAEGLKRCMGTQLGRQVTPQSEVHGTEGDAV